jgi:diguanylate cyclase (GGDEF)-like protein
MTRRGVVYSGSADRGLAPTQGRILSFPIFNVNWGRYFSACSQATLRINIVKTLIIDDDEILSQQLIPHLNRGGYTADRASNAAEAIAFLKEIPYDLILLDTLLPDADGIEFCRSLRSQGIQSPVMLMHGQNQRDAIDGLKAEADDAIQKPFGLADLDGRIKALLRRNRSVQHQVLDWRGVQIDLATSQITFQQRSLRLGQRERSLLVRLFQDDQRIYSQSSLLKYLWSIADDLPGEEAVRTLIRRLRKKLETIQAGELIETVYGLGYRLSVDWARPATAVPPNHQAQRVAQQDIQIVALDDDPLILKLLQKMLQPWGIQVHVLSESNQLLGALDRMTPDMLILDLNLPDANGIELCQMLRANSQWADLPIIILTSQRDSETIRQVFDAGADDFVSKPIVPPEFMARLLNRFERSRSFQERYSHDVLTGLDHQTRGADRLTRQIEQLDGAVFCLVVIQLTQLTELVAEYGHAVRDRWLKLFALTLQQALPDALLSRWHGGEFVIGMNCTQAVAIAEFYDIQLKLQQVTVSPMRINPVTINLAIVQRSPDCTDLATLFQQAMKQLVETA